VLSEPARAAIHAASEEARVRHQQVGTPHLLLGLLSGTSSRPAEALEAMGVSIAAVRYEALRRIGPPARRVRRRFRPPMSRRVQAVLDAAHTQARRDGAVEVELEHLLLALAADPEAKAAQLLSRLRVQSA
jgi:ATP-dependent Clp protease ATP-binding subunit ClpC